MEDRTLRELREDTEPREGCRWVSENQSIPKARTRAAFSQELPFQMNLKASGSSQEGGGGGHNGNRIPGKGNISEGTETELLPQLLLITNPYGLFHAHQTLF